MPANIPQHVIPRHRSNHLPSWKLQQLNSWTNRTRSLSSRLQAGSINSTTLTLALTILVIIFIAFLGFFYLGQVMGTAAQSTDIQDMEERIVELREKQRELELKGAELRSIQTVEQNINQLNLVGIDKVAYLNMPTDQLASAE